MIEVVPRGSRRVQRVNVPFTQWRSSFPAAIDGVLAGARAADARMVFVDDT
jgi:hypothetical protein